MQNCSRTRAICKWKDKSAVTEETLEKISRLFDGASGEEGVEKAELIRNCVDRENRFDLMIRIHMRKDALENWDRSAIHRRWKEEYGDLIEKKTIFDEE